MSRKGEARCGTPSGYGRHQARGEKPCDACARSKRDYDLRWRSSPQRTRLNRLHARTQSRAEVQLRKAHPDEYEAYYQAHKVALLREAEDAERQS